MKELCTLRPKTYAYLLDDDNEIKRAKGTQKCVIKHKLMFENYKDFLFNMYTEKINEIALNSCNDNKRIQTFDGVTTYPYGAHDFNIVKLKFQQKKIDIPIKLYYYQT